MNPQDMTVFITGATAGFGIEAARRFVRGGARVIATGRRQERLDALKKELGDACHVARLDVTDYDAVKACVDSLPSPFNEISVLINNAGLALGLGPAHKANMDEWRQMLDTNVNGVVHCTHVILPGMVARNRGHIINVGSVGGRKPNPGSNIYGATKAFVHLFSKNLRAEVLGSDVRVTCLEPGIAESEFNLVRYEGDKEKADAGYKGLQPITSSEIAEVMFYCVSLPDHININVYQLMPVMQADSGWQIHRRA
jgi:3-hydroxy acid dehydrogenase/malonic semialdehyde reductase